MFSEARAISKFAQDMFLKGEVDQRGRAVHELHQHADAAAGDCGPSCRMGEVSGLDSEGRGRTGVRSLEDAGVEYLFEPSAGRGAGRTAPALS